MEIDPRRDGLDRRQVDVIVGMRQDLIGGRHRRAARAALGIDVARHVRVRAQLASHARPPLAPFLSGCRWSDVGLLPARRRQRRVVRRLRRLTATPLELGDAGVQSFDLGEQIVDLRQQRPQQRIGAGLVERIRCLGSHPELESVRHNQINATDASQTAA